MHAARELGNVSLHICVPCRMLSWLSQSLDEVYSMRRSPCVVQGVILLERLHTLAYHLWTHFFPSMPPGKRLTQLMLARCGTSRIGNEP